MTLLLRGCPRCGGDLLPDEDGEYVCLLCSRQPERGGDDKVAWLRLQCQHCKLRGEKLFTCVHPYTGKIVHVCYKCERWFGTIRRKRERQEADREREKVAAES